MSVSTGPTDRFRISQCRQASIFHGRAPGASRGRPRDQGPDRLPFQDISGISVATPGNTSGEGQ
jgi:hypothetical protein